jgi:acetyl-CoA carboxylase carboxyl transferase subunit alpha
MQEFSVYSVIPPEGCAAILWRDANRKVEAAEALKITAQDLLGLGLIDRIVPEPPGAAHADPAAAAELLGGALREELARVTAEPIDALLEQRYEKYRRIGAFVGG